MYLPLSLLPSGAYASLGTLAFCVFDSSSGQWSFLVAYSSPCERRNTSFERCNDIRANDMVCADFHHTEVNYLNFIL